MRHWSLIPVSSLHNQFIDLLQLSSLVTRSPIIQEKTETRSWLYDYTLTRNLVSQICHTASKNKTNLIFINLLLVPRFILVVSKTAGLILSQQLAGRCEGNNATALEVTHFTQRFEACCCQQCSLVFPWTIWIRVICVSTYSYLQVLLSAKGGR